MQADSKKRIIFVDDDRNVLDGLRRMLHPMREKWDIEFAESGKEALSALNGGEHEMIITDLRMPEMDGITLLEKVRENHPGVIRIMLTGQTVSPTQGRAARCVHQFISKPFEAAKLIELIESAAGLHSKIKNKKVSKILSDLQSLPVLPKAYEGIIEKLNSDTSSPRQIGEMISRDIGLTTKILQLANSAHYGTRTKIVDPVRAVVQLGLSAVKALVLSNTVFSKLSEELEKEFRAEGFQEHCMRVGILARQICCDQGMDDESLQLASMAGILHDTGKILLIAKFPDEYRGAIRISRTRETGLHQAEEEAIGVSHTEIGGSLLELWGLANTIIASAAFHHDIEKSLGEEFDITSAVYLANAIDHNVCSSPGDGCFEEVDENLLKEYGCYEIFQERLRMCISELNTEYINVA